MDNQDIFIIGTIGIVICYLIAEFWGRGKHIGKGWSFALLTTTLIFGLIALLLSPSAKKEHTHGNAYHKFFGWVSIIFGCLNIYRMNPLAIGFIVLGIYLILLAKSKIQNNNPKYYFDQMKNIKTELSGYEKKAKSNNNTEYLYYIIEDTKQSEPLTIEELKSKHISEHTYVWRKNLPDWTLAGSLNELNSVIHFTPPPFNKNRSEKIPIEKTTYNKEEEFIIADKVYTKHEIQSEFDDGNYFIRRGTKITNSDGTVSTFENIDELKFILDYYPPD